MSDYISREAAIAYIREQSEEMGKAFEALGGESGIYADAYNDLAEEFHRIPAANVEPVRRGKWLDCEAHNDIEQCSECGMIFSYPSYYGYKFCPNCGAKMDLEDENDG